MILVIGSGVAGLSCALAAVDAGADVRLATAGRLRADDRAGAGASAAGCAAELTAGGNTVLAQGGIAAAIGADDAWWLHRDDTVAAGGGLVDHEAAAVLAREGREAVLALLGQGFAADRDSDGGLSLGLEGAHSRNRIVHSGGDRTGAALHAFLVGRTLAAVQAGRLALLEERFAEELLAESGAVVGAVLRDRRGVREAHRADAVVLATGGYAAAFPRTSNSAGARGDGIVLAARVGALIADLEFVQFHPTALQTSAIGVGAGPAGAGAGGSSGDGAGAGADADAGAVGTRGGQLGSAQLISEAVRGAGAVLHDGDGVRFMPSRHPLAELAPRDAVSREIHRVLEQRGDSAVWLDATGIEEREGPGALARRFPGITAMLTAHGIDWTREPVPVAPAAHYTMGGVASDLDGRSSVPGLFVAGEVASTGVHGANRLASNSLLEGLVFGARAGRAAAEFGDQTDRGTGNGDDPGSPAQVRPWSLHGSGMRALAEDCHVVAVLQSAAGNAPASENPLSEMIRTAAGARTESRGAHRRDDHPEIDPAQASRRAFRFLFPVEASDLVGAELPASETVSAFGTALVSEAVSTPAEPRSLSTC